jgi:uncharacterized protein YecE (DUF72 family)
MKTRRLTMRVSVQPIQPSLFETEPSYPKEALAAAVRALAKRNIFIGTSSWRYEGWLGQIYTPQRYFTRGRFSKTKFHEECIHEYAEVFPVAGGDFSFYAAPTPEFWKKLFSTAPPALKWSLKVPEDFTRKVFSQQARYGARRGLANPAFLDAGLFEAVFVGPLAPHLDRIAVLIFEFGTFSGGDYDDRQAFAHDLAEFLDRLPATVRYCVEIRNDSFLDARYFEALRKHGIAHVFNSWTRMPSLGEQLKIDGAFTAPFTVSRALLRPGRLYEQAVAMFSPYREVRDEYPEGREALREVIRESMERKLDAYLHVNNRLEGNAIETIRAIAESPQAE